MSDLKELSNFDITDILDKKNIFINGVFSKDLLPEKLKKGFYIINIQNSNDGNGTHWTCLYHGDKKNLYLDSFGSPAPLEVQNNLKEYFFNDKQIQNNDSTACGYYCIAFIQYMNDKDKNEKELQKFLNIFKTNSKHNDLILKNIINEKYLKNCV